MIQLRTALFIGAAGLCGGLAQADTGKLLLTGGVSSIDGAAGGGLTPWAVIGTNATEGDEFSALAAMHGECMDYASDIAVDGPGDRLQRRQFRRPLGARFHFPTVDQLVFAGSIQPSAA